MKHIIAGIDTGKTSAIACLDLGGRLVLSQHKTFAGVEWLVSAIGEAGVPTIIACDKEPNDVARKVCAAFNAKLYYPARDMGVEEKKGIAIGLGISNPHERDACAAAMKAYNSYANKLKQAERLARSMNVGDVDAIKAKVIGEHSISEAINGRKANRGMPGAIP